MLASGVRAAVGTNHGGVDGFARTHEEAAASKRVTEILPGISEPIVDFPSVHLLTLLAQDKGKATYFVQAELSDLAGDDAQHSELRKTAIAYLRHRRSPLAAAQELFVVRNTVAYRLKRVEDLLGHSLDERTLETWAALVLKESLVCGTSATREELSSRP
jgi:DNA-binding PucR family transcriptional regulator